MREERACRTKKKPCRDTHTRKIRFSNRRSRNRAFSSRASRRRLIIGRRRRIHFVSNHKDRERVTFIVVRVLLLVWHDRKK